MKLVNWQKGTLIKRYKRFLADITLPDGKVITAHCPNSGTMETCWEKGDEVIITLSDNPKRKLPYTLELIKHKKSWIGVNTHRANNLVAEALNNQKIDTVKNISEWQREKKYGKEKSRIDFWATKNEQEIFIEVKSVTYQLENDTYFQFPDAKTERGQKHLRELTTIAEQGHRAILLFVIQRQHGSKFKVAKHIDPLYNQLFLEAISKGVEALVYTTYLSTDEITITGKTLPYEI